MKVIHINAGNEYGGGLSHIISLLSTLKLKETDAELLVLEEGPVAAAARSEGIKVTVIQQSSRYDFSVLKKLISYIKSNQVDIVHTHGPRANMVMSLINNFFKAKWVVTLHSNPYKDFNDRGLKGQLFGRINVFSVKKADKIITVSNEINKIMQQKGIKKDKIQTVYNGIRFAAPLNKPKAMNVFQIIAVGRLESVKNFSFLLKVLAENKQLNWKLALCGEGLERESLVALAHELNIVDRIEFTGWLNKEKLYSKISESHLMVLSSISEGFPVSLLQAAEQEVPCVATNVGDVETLLHSPKYGWLIESNDGKALDKSLNDAYKQWETGRLADKGKCFRHGAEQFSLSNQVNEVVKIYEKLL